MEQQEITIRTKDGIEKVMAKKVDLFDWLETYIYQEERKKDEEGKDITGPLWWVVSENISGTRMGYGRTQTIAKDGTMEIVSSRGKEAVLKRINELRPN